MNKLRCWCLLVCVLFASSAVGQRPPRTSPDDQDSRADQPVTIFEGHAAGVTALAFSPDGGRVVSASASDVLIWNPATGKEIGVVKGLGGRVVAISPDGKSLAVAGRESVTLHDATSGKQLLSIDPHGDFNRNFPFRPTVAAVAFSPDGRRLATAGSVAKVGGPHGYPGGVVIVWDVTTGKALQRFATLSTGAAAVAFSADGTSVAAGTNGAGGELPEPGEVWVWDAETGKTLQTLKTKATAEPGEFTSVADVAFSPDGKRVAAAASAGSRGRPAGLLIDDAPSAIKVWDLASGRVLLTLVGHTAWVGRVAFRPDGKQLASAGGDRVVRVWDAATGRQLQVFPCDAERIDALAFSPDGRRLAAGANGAGKPGEIRVWSRLRD